MRDDPFTPAELEAGRRAVLEADPSETRPVAHTYAVLGAVAPLIAARVRAECVPAIIAECNRTRQATRYQTAEEIAEDLLSVVGREGGLWAAVIARTHRTTPGGDHA